MSVLCIYIPGSHSSHKTTFVHKWMTNYYCLGRDACEIFLFNHSNLIIFYRENTKLERTRCEEVEERFEGIDINNYKSENVLQ